MGTKKIPTVLHDCVVVCVKIGTLKQILAGCHVSLSTREELTVS
jgi:hypothetical protein